MQKQFALCEKPLPVTDRWRGGLLDCALNGEYSSFKRRTPESESLSTRGLKPRSVVSRKVVFREGSTEVSEPAKDGTDEQKLHMRQACAEE